MVSYLVRMDKADRQVKAVVEPVVLEYQTPAAPQSEEQERRLLDLVPQVISDLASHRTVETVIEVVQGGASGVVEVAGKVSSGVVETVGGAFQSAGDAVGSVIGGLFDGL